MKCAVVWAGLMLSTAVVAQPAVVTDAPVEAPILQTRVEAKLREAPAGTRIGLVVATANGREIVAVLPDERFIPASNTKLFTTAAAYATLVDMTAPDGEGGTSVRLDGRDVMLIGHGDARMSGAAACVIDCLTTLANAVAAQTRTVRDIVGDATWFPDQRWSAGMSWNNVSEQSGTGIAALSIDDAQVPLVVRAGPVGQAPITVTGAAATDAYFVIDNQARTTAAGPTTLDVTRLPFERTVRLVGTIAVGAPPETIRLGIDDPAHHAAWTFAAMLRARGVRVSGTVRSIYRPGLPDAQPALPVEPPALARLIAAPLADDAMIINKVSQNQHAEALLRRLGRVGGDGSVGAGLAAVRTMLDRARVPRAAYDFSDGSGMSTYNRIAPRGVVGFLNWTQTQPWGAAWRATLPIGGVDGTIAKRFKGTVLDGRIMAKTGGLNATSALSGFLTAASGQRLTFSILANDIPDGARAISMMDDALVMVAQAN